MIWILSLFLIILIGIATYVFLIIALKSKESADISADDFDITEIKEKEY